MDGQFEDLMKDIDFDEMAFAVPDGRADDDDASMRDDASDKTVRHLPRLMTTIDGAAARKTVRNGDRPPFTRDEFLTARH